MNLPTWRFQLQGRDAVAQYFVEQTGGLTDLRTTQHRVFRTDDGVIIEEEMRFDGDGGEYLWRAVDIFVIDGDTVTEHTPVLHRLLASRPDRPPGRRSPDGALVMGALRSTRRAPARDRGPDRRRDRDRLAQRRRTRTHELQGPRRARRQRSTRPARSAPSNRSLPHGTVDDLIAVVQVGGTFGGEVVPPFCTPK